MGNPYADAVVSFLSFGIRLHDGYDPGHAADPDDVLDITHTLARVDLELDPQDPRQIRVKQEQPGQTKMELDIKAEQGPLVGHVHSDEASDDSDGVEEVLRLVPMTDEGLPDLDRPVHDFDESVWDVRCDYMQL